jgi:putative FmdB family regulatory protein
MPIFEYKCSDCGKITEVLVKGSRSPKPACEHCGSKNTKKQFSTFSAQVKQTQSPLKENCQSCRNQSCPYSGGM